jgi:hypothetical protein
MPAVAVGRAVARPPPARIPACGAERTALGSSDRLASASLTALAFSEVGTGTLAFHSQSVFPVQAASACQSLPPVNGVTVSEYYGLIRLPATLGSPTWPFGSAYLSSVGDNTHVPTQE